MLFSKLPLAAIAAAAVALSQTPQGGTPPFSPKSESQTQERDLSSGDRNFIKKTAEKGHKEVALAKLGVEKASSAEVKSFSEKLVEDHTKANQELAQFAQKKGIDLQDKPAKDHGKMSNLSGAQFDRAYMKMMVDGHEKSVREFERASTSAGDPELRAWAAKTLPTLREHLEKAKSISQNLRSVSTTASSESK
jgi:putative membrane protein